MPDYQLGKLKGELVVTFREGGRRKRFRLGTRDPAEGRRRLQQFIDARERRPDAPATVAEMWSEYIADRNAEGKAAVKRMQEAWKPLEPHFATQTPDALRDGEKVRAYIAYRRNRGCKDPTIRSELTYLRAALNKAARRYGFTPPSFTLPPHGRPRERWLNGDEARALIEAAHHPHVKLFILLSLYTAGRPSAILDLTWGRVDFDRRRISLDDPERHRTAKGRATVPMAEELVKPLQEAHSGAISPFVIEWGGKQVKSVKKGIANAAERAGLEGITPYVLRHTSAVWMVQGGTPIEEVAQYLGHTNPSVTYRAYARFGPDYLRRASDTIGTVLFGQTEPEQKNRP